MGFFSDLKQDLNQAVNELLPAQEEDDTLKQLEELEETLKGIDSIQEEQAAAARAMEEAQAAEEERKLSGEKESLEETFAAVEAEGAKDVLEIKAAEAKAASEIKAAEAKAAEAAKEAEEAKAAMEKETEISEEIQAIQIALEEAEGAKAAGEAENKAEPKGENKVDAFVNEEAMKTGESVIDKSWVLDLRSMEQMEETAVITAGMRVKGDILSNGSADIFGEVYGNVQVKGKLNVTGKISGNSKAQEVLADAARINGDVISDGAVKIGVGTVVVGNVEATDAIIAGAVKGTIDVKGPVIIDATAVVLGNVRAKSIQINNGARIEGMCVLCYAEQSAAKFFEEQDQ